MAEIRPFQAIRYDQTRWGGDLSNVIAPPYDVLDQSDKEALLSRSDHNIVAIDLPHIPPKSAGPPEVYQRSAQMLDGWLESGALVRESQPALYVYHQVFEHDGKRYTRRKFIARLRLVPFSEGIVLPHEQTFGGPKEDRLALTKATRCNVSPVFALYTDPQDAVGQALARITSRQPEVVATTDDVENRLWVITEAAVTEAVTAVMAEKRIFIADGHHRYGTALNYRQFVTGQSGALPGDHPANYVMVVLGSMDDPGSLILPYNRVLVGPDATVGKIIQTWSTGCEEVDAVSADLTLYGGARQSESPLRFTNRRQLRRLEPQRSDAWRGTSRALTMPGRWPGRSMA
ncbi:MAG: DUF1015 family protein [Planctomycetota bacterium]|jgi:uncharacterized protein (DUF1015 family)